MLEIDGSQGEGGGQILRTSVALSAVTGKPVRITRIRYNRSKPGLAAQHITGIKAAGMLCNAEVTGLSPGSTEVEFWPAEIKEGKHKLDIGTAGSITLVLQACLPVAACAEGPTELQLTGGTDVKFSPPLDYFRHVIAPLLERTGLTIELPEVKRGYYPRGGGRVTVRIIPPSDGLKPLQLDLPFELVSAGGLIHYAGLPGHIAGRLKKTVREEFSKVFDSFDLAVDTEQVEMSYSPGVGITLWATSGDLVMGSSALGEKGVPAEKLAIKAVADLHTDIISGASVDEHAADQLLPFIAICGGSIRARTPLSDHARTNMDVIEQFYGEIFGVESSLLFEQISKLSQKG